MSDHPHLTTSFVSEQQVVSRPVIANTGMEVGVVGLGGGGGGGVGVGVGVGG